MVLDWGWMIGLQNAHFPVGAAAKDVLDCPVPKTLHTQSHFAGFVKPLVAVVLAKSENSKTTTESLLRMSSAFYDPSAQDSNMLP